MKIKNRILAGVSAAIMAVGAASVLPVSYLSASAIQIPAYNETTGKISKFEYTVKVEKISSTRVKVAFQILNNPGYERLSIGIKSDAKYISDNCDMGNTAYVESTKTAFLAIAAPNTAKVCSTWEFIYDISANPNKSYDFGVAVVDYKSAAENIELKHDGEGFEATLNALKKGVTIESNNKTVLIGDADNDGYITIQDASLILDVVSKCEKNGIEFFYKSIDVEKFANNNKMGTEEAGRFVRYEFFDEVAKKVGANKIAIAHNKNDSAETIIMNILRGTGVSGLKGIEPIKNNKYIRPLINCKREEIENYCEKNSLNPRIDKTNFENVYTRNKVRNIVIPYIKKEFNSNIVETITRLSELVKEDDDFIQNIVKEKYNDLCLGEEEKEIILNLKKFNLEEKVIKSKILLYTITRLMGNTQGVYKIHIEDIIKLCENNVGNKFLTPNKNIKILVKNHKIYFINQKNYNL